MAKQVIMPRFGMTQEEATIVQWIKSDGERVEKGDPICEVTTDKVNMEVEAPQDGILSDIRYKEGDTVPVTLVIATIMSEQERRAFESGPAAAKTESEPESRPTQPVTPPPAVAATPLAKRMAAAEGVSLDGVPGSGAGGKITREDVRRELNGRALQDTNGGHPVEKAPAAIAPTAFEGKVPASPAARSLAREHGIDLKNVPGSGPEGRVQGWDVSAYAHTLQVAQDQASVQAQPAVADGAAQPAQLPGVEVIPLEGMRKTIADRLQASYQQAPHIFMDLEIDMGRAMALREALNPRRPEGRQPLSLTVLIVRACALALRDQPLLNSHFVDGQIRRFQEINIGMAVALEEGLIVPVIHAADQQGLNGLGDTVAELSLKAREGRLRPDDVSGGTFTISNLGMFGIDHFTAILNPPQVGILAVGRVARRFVPGENDQPVARSLMNVSLSADHRVIDGLVGARFLSALKNYLENPNLLIG